MVDGFLHDRAIHRRLPPDQGQSAMHREQGENDNRHNRHTVRDIGGFDGFRTPTRHKGRLRAPLR